MPPADTEPGRQGQSTADLVVIGGGVAGAWTALKALRQGLSVVLVERERIGAGASGGFLGALMPHMPERWDDKKAFQFESLVALEAEVARLGSETGLPVLYHRVGRLMPLATERQARTAHARGDAARAVWGGGFVHEVKTADCAPGWLAPDAAPAGVAHDTLSARLSPPHLMAALEAALSRHPRCRVLDAEATQRIDPARRWLELADGTRIGFGHLVIASGIAAFGLIEALTGEAPGSLGGPVKGQAALFEPVRLPDIPDRLPVLYRDGVYVIAHGDGRLAVGSTSETEFTDPFTTDAALDQVMAKAGELCPALAGAREIARWAGLRPRPAGRDPMLGRLPGFNHLSAIAGGYKISFGIAHRMADALLAEIGAGTGPAIPPSFRPEAHFAKARERSAQKEAATPAAPRQSGPRR